MSWLVLSAVLASAGEPNPTIASRVTVLPGVGWRADPHGQVDGVSVGLTGRAASLKGFDGQAFLSWVAGDVQGVQAAGLVAIATGEVRQAQLAGLVSAVEGDVRGVQGAGIANVATGDDSHAAQLAGVANVAGTLEGLQAAPLNIGREVRGAQIGLVNIGREVHGLQLGLVNIAREAHGTSIAPLNFIGNGLFHIDVWASESAAATADLKFGSRTMYTLIGAGYVRAGDPWWTWGGGFGAHIPRGPLWFEVDATAWGVGNGLEVLPGALGKLRLNAGLQLASRLAPFVGVSANTWWGTGDAWPRVVGLPSRSRGSHQLVSWPGVHAGVQF